MYSTTLLLTIAHCTIHCVSTVTAAPKAPYGIGAYLTAWRTAITLINVCKVIKATESINKTEIYLAINRNSAKS